jgi:small subunit ribosomal protein S9
VIKNLGIGTGRRKTAVARVFIREEQKGKHNGKELPQYFVQGEHSMMVRQPLMVTACENKYDVLINVTGGGPNGQAGACRHGLARALCQVDHTNYSALRNNGFLTATQEWSNERNMDSLVHAGASSSQSVNLQNRFSAGFPAKKRNVSVRKWSFLFNDRRTHCTLHGCILFFMTCKKQSMLEVLQINLFLKLTR